jgi:hypothetical protein
MSVEINGLTAKKAPDEILEELVHSVRETNVLGLFIEGEEEMVTTAVHHITETANETLVFFQPCDLHGYPLRRNPVNLLEIKSVIHFNTLFNDPVYVNIRARKNERKDNLAA